MKTITFLFIAFLLLGKANATNTWTLKNFPDSVTINGIATNSMNEVFVTAYYWDEGDDYTVGIAYKSTDDGNTWEQIIHSEYFPSIMDILIDIQDNIYLGTWYGGCIYKSVDHGNTWESYENGLSNCVPVYLSITSKGVLYAGQEWGAGIDYSVNGGETWQPTNHPSNGGIKGLGVSMNDYLFSDGGTYSSDGGNTWHTNNAGFSDYALWNNVRYAFNKNDEAFAGTVEGVYYLGSIDASWEKTLSTDGYILGLITTSQNEVFAATNDDIFYSANNGQNWENINNQFSDSKPRKFCFDKEGYLWAASENQIYKSNAILTTIHTITVSVSPMGSGTVNGLVDFSHYYEEGKKVTLKAEPNPDYQFSGWTENGVIVSNNETYSFNVVESRTLVAQFKDIDTSVTENNDNSAVLFPNPSTHFVTIRLPHNVTYENVFVEIFNKKGQEIARIPINEFTTVLDFSPYQAGILYYRIKTNSMPIQSGKIIIIK
jgi:hypothetical protein